MTHLRWPAPASVLLLSVLLLTACGQGAPAAGAPGTSGADPAAPALDLPHEGLVLRVEHVGGFLTPTLLATRVPTVSVYADGLVISEGPQIEPFPPPALPNLVQRRIDPADVTALAQRALDAGAGQGLDLGQPPIADAPSTRVVVVTASGRRELEAYALAEAADLDLPGASDLPHGVTEEQDAAREALRDLVRALTDLPGTLGEQAAGPEEPYRPAAVAAFVTPWVDLSEGQPELVRSEVAWPGPALPGEPLAPQLDLSCVTATGEQATAVLAAASTANALTPWVHDGQRWALGLRPLLPEETGCAAAGGYPPA